MRLQLQLEPEWRLTRVAAQKLGVSSEQLRKLRRRGLFKSGYHYRDISVPGSGKSRWQWHLTRCGQALESPSASRKIHIVR
ncbi:DNA-binding protein [Leptolyngbya sp. FACHB-1624]|nr:DNA-binding protein [Leptolyngbya sp. FACHB-1624]